MLSSPWVSLIINCIADFGPLWTGLSFCWFHLIRIYVPFVDITNRILMEVSSDRLRPLYSYHYYVM